MVSIVGYEKLQPVGRNIVNIHVRKNLFYGKNLSAFGGHVTEDAFLALKHREIDARPIGKKVGIADQSAQVRDLANSSHLRRRDHGAKGYGRERQHKYC